MKKFLLAGLPLLALLIAGGTWFFANKQARNIVDERIAAAMATGAYDSITYESLDLMPNGDIEMQNLIVGQQGFRYILEQIHVSNLDYGHEIPWSMDVEINGLQFPDGLPRTDTTSNPLLARFMQGIAVDSIPLNLQYAYQYDPDQENQIDSSAAMELPGSFLFNMSSRTRGIPLETVAGNASISGDPANTSAMLNNALADASVLSASMSMQDTGFLDDIINLMAEQNSVTPEDFRNYLVTQARNFYLFVPQSAQGLAMTTGIQLASFLEGGRTLSVSVEPQMGGKVQQLQAEVMGAAFTGDFNRIADLLNLEIMAR